MTNIEIFIDDEFDRHQDKNSVPRNLNNELLFEGSSTISYQAAKTERMKLGQLMTYPFFRLPGLLIKTVPTLDMRSKRYALLEIGSKVIPQVGGNNGNKKT